MTSAKQLFDREYTNLELYQLIWLESNSNDQSNRIEKRISTENLRSIIDYTKFFHDVDECFDYINKTQDSMTLLVSTDETVIDVLTNDQHPKNLLGVYVLCNSEKSIPKIVRTYTDVDALLSDLTAAVKLKSNSPGLTTDDLYQTWWADFIDILCHIIYPSDSLNKLVAALQEYYRGNTTAIAKLTQFELEYKSEDAILWYTRDTCIYRVLNEALRQHHVERLFLFGFYVQDLFRQLTTEYEHFRSLSAKNNCKTITYRYQLMSTNEIENLKKRTRLFLAANSLFSTTLDRQVAMFMLESLSSARHEKELESVLFLIELDVRMTSRPYANISHLSNFPEESEVLFSIGTEFEIIDVNYNENVWIVDLRLNGNCFKYSEDLARLTPRRAFISCVDKLIHTYQVPSPEEVENIFNGLQRLHPEEKWIPAAKHYCWAQYQQHIIKDYEKAMLEYDTAIDIWRECIPDNDSELNCWSHIGDIHGSIGAFCHSITKDKALAKNIYTVAMSNYKAINLEFVDDFARTDMLSNLAGTAKSVATMSDDGDEKRQAYLYAIEHYKLCLKNMMKCYLPTSTQYATYYTSLADVYKVIEDYDNAIDNYINALNIRTQHFGIAHSLIISLCEEIVEIDFLLHRNHERQLKYQLMKHEHLLRDETEDVRHNHTTYHKEELGKSHAALTYIYIKMDQQQAVDLLQPIGKLDSSEICIIESIEVLK
ncbi:unnamed protein product [Adineta ricciae]|uniref:NAD(P)(+)--arginine ADP-ribosyltransferase n=1 Tax=Adineta ricciae TaxID=249248 RepID=A0A815CA81_ADIRI|nr:unnamed protein product [Adineta ricciae]